MDAQYFHSTLYRFNAEGRQAIVHRVNATLNDASARCFYDAERECFELRCPTSIGPQADEALANTIRDYIVQEQLASEGEDVSFEFPLSIAWY